MVATLFLIRSISAWFLQLIACMGGCLGSSSKTKLTSSVHEPLNGQKHLDHLVHKAKLSADFWTTSTCDMDNHSAAQSRGSISSISTSTQTHDAHGTANTTNHSEFVNHVGMLPMIVCWGATSHLPSLSHLLKECMIKMLQAKAAGQIVKGVGLG
ncbi:uncharacterized protein LOC132598727 isoform X4 [Lycium barbarum]|uniref:uncharacterized protein LOC132598727 isoform X4 n=1 Tax=Lycium barbarum TaxID=112863 RepID=UPI00293F2152|nr:uncharacterized protein LOC132598727 isoform X4 [Lycium barbarum]